MDLTVLYAGPAEESADWSAALTAGARAQGVEFELVSDLAAVSPEKVDMVLFAPDGPAHDLRVFPNLKAVQSLWAGVEKIVSRPDLPRSVPIARMVDPGMTAGMVEYVTSAVLRAHLGHERLAEERRAGRWSKATPPLARQRRVGVMGLGVLGAACAAALRDVGFDMRGWSRTPKQIDGVDCRHGEAALPVFLSDCEILVLLVPLTPETRGLLDANALAKLPSGAHVINVARGPILDEGALLQAVRRPDGLGGATLDVFDVEPLPTDHPFWGEPRIMITPHIASVTRPETAAPEVVAQIGRLARGEPLLHLVDLDSGY